MINSQRKPWRSKQQRTFGSFYFAIDHPLPFPLWQRLSLDLIRLTIIPKTYLNKLLTYGFRFCGGWTLCLKIGNGQQAGSKKK
ncbi:hypothetical protein J2Y64_000819 [Aeromonas salmonicida]|nr:hypothetical protein [Aeromonas salmonicida]